MSRYCMYCMEQIEEQEAFCGYCGKPTAIEIEFESHHLQAGLLLAGRYYMGKVLLEKDEELVYIAKDLQENKKVIIHEYYLRNAVIRFSHSSTMVMEYPHTKELFAEGKQEFLNKARYKSSSDILCDIFEFNNTAYYVTEYVDISQLEEMSEENAVEEMPNVAEVEPEQTSEAAEVEPEQTLEVKEVEPEQTPEVEEAPDNLEIEETSVIDESELEQVMEEKIPQYQPQMEMEKKIPEYRPQPAVQRNLDYLNQSKQGPEAMIVLGVMAVLIIGIIVCIIGLMG